MAKCKYCTECILINKETNQYCCYNSIPYRFVNINKDRLCYYFNRSK